MANTRANNVIVVDTSAAFEGPLYIKAVKYVAGAGASPAANIKQESATGTTIYEASGSGNLFEQACINAASGAYVTITDGAKLYLYLK